MTFKSLARFGKLLLFLGAFVVLFTVFLRCFFIDVDVVRGSSMEPYLVNNDVVAVVKNHNDSYFVGNVVVLLDSYGIGYSMVKRVIAVEGDVVSVTKKGHVFVNGVPVSVVDVDDPLSLVNYCLKEDEYFVIGDNREDSYDSRMFGVCNGIQILGRVLNRIWPWFR